MRRTLGQAFADAAQKARRQRYGWCRLDNDFPDLPIWRAVAARTNVRVHQVVAVVLRLECLANRSDPRGSVADMSVPEFAAALQLSPNTVARIRAALEEPDIAWVDQDFVVSFHQRNPDHDDHTAAERQRRHRAKLRAARAEYSVQSATGPPGYQQSRDVTRDTVTVTAHQITDKNSNASAAGAARAQEVANKNSGDSGETPGAPDLWLETQGLRIVVERMQCVATIARVKIERWRREVDDDAQALIEILSASDKADFMGARFHNLVVDGIRRHRHNIRGPQLPLPPAAVRRAGNG